MSGVEGWRRCGGALLLDASVAHKGILQRCHSVSYQLRLHVTCIPERVWSGYGYMNYTVVAINAKVILLSVFASF